MNYSDRDQPNPSAIKATFAIIFALLASAGIAVVSHYAYSGFSWFGGVPRLIHLLSAGALIGVFPAVAALVVVRDRYREGQSTILPAVIAASGAWLLQYAVLLVSLRMGPSFSDGVYAIVSVFCAALLAVFVSSGSRTPASR
jgi:hypothetical protein